MLRVASIIVLVGLGSTAQAHVGMPPGEIDAVVVDGGAGLGLEATFGLLLDTDDGWRWYCHETVAQLSAQVMPSYALGDGVILATLPSLGQGVVPDATLYRSEGGCDWGAPDGVSGQHVTAVAFDADDADLVIAVTGNAEGPGVILRSTDAGETFTTVLDGPIRLFRSVRSGGGHAWATSLRLDTLEAVLHHSADGGVTWTEHVVDNGALPGAVPLLDAIALEDGGASVWLSWEDGSGAGSLLLASDGGAAYEARWEAPGRVLDGGQDADGTLWVATDAGLHRTSDGVAFEAVEGAHGVVGVDARAGRVLFAVDFRTTGFSLAEWDGEALQPLFRLHELAGPAVCAAESDSVEACDPNWNIVRDALPDPVEDEGDEADPDPIPVDDGCCPGGGVSDGGASVALLGLLLGGGVARRRS